MFYIIVLYHLVGDLCVFPAQIFVLQYIPNRHEKITTHEKLFNKP